MCLRNTARWAAVALATAGLLAPATAQPSRTDWRRIGNAALSLSLPSVATGPVERVWYSEDGSRLYARAAADRTFVTGDFETWSAVPLDQSTPVAPEEVTVSDSSGTRRPSSRTTAGQRPGAMQRDGSSIDQTTAAGRGPALPTSKAARFWATASSIWRCRLVTRTSWSSHRPPASGGPSDGGQSWSGLNEAFPNLPVRRLLGHATKYARGQGSHRRPGRT